MPKFLIIRFSSIGDIVLTTPVIRCLKKQMPEAEVHFLTKKTFASILQSNPYIDKLHLHENSLKDTINQLRQEQFDYIIDLHKNARTFRVKLGLGVKSFSFEKLNIEKWAVTALKVNWLPDIHIVDRYLNTLQSFGIKNDGGGLDYFIPEDQNVTLETLPDTHKAGFVGLVIGAAHATKQLPVEKLKTLCRSVLHPILLLGGPEDVANGEKIAYQNPLVFNACGKFPLNQSADLVRQAKLIVTHDTGLMHIAAAFNKPIISIWGNTIPKFGMDPYYAEHSKALSEIYQVANLACRPCSKIGYLKCPKGHFNCMQQQDLGSICETIEQFWVQIAQ